MMKRMGAKFFATGASQHSNKTMIVVNRDYGL